MERKKRYVRLSLGARLTLICYLFTLVPAIVFSIWLSNDWREKAVQDRTEEMQRNLYLLAGSVSQTSNLCNLSTQVFLNTRSLSNYLQNLSDGISMSSGEVFEFFRSDISALEKLVVGNPYLYTIRVYSVAENITEMMPILFGADRMEKMPWGQSIQKSGTWCLDYPDELFAVNRAQHIMSLLTNIKGKNGELIGVLEVGVPMDELMPQIFEDTEGLSDFLVMDDGKCFGSTNARSQLMEKVHTLPTEGDPTVVEISNGTQSLLVGAIYLESIGGTYFAVENLAGLNEIIQNRQLLLLIGFSLSAVVLFFIVNGLVKNVLRQFYRVLDGVKNFSEGDLNAEITTGSNDEIGVFANQVNNLLDNIRELMKTNVEREVLVKNTEIKALQNQINAHFIYNVLEAIKMMAEIEENYPVADAMTNLGKLLRYSMRWNRKEVALKEELDYVNNYLALMNLRFDYTIELCLEVPDSLMEMMVPKISIQPIVENAVIHGCVGLKHDSVIRVSAYRKDNICYISISDDGSGLEKEQLEKVKKQLSGLAVSIPTTSNGIGLKNVQDRIHMLFGEDYGIVIQSEEAHGTTVTIKIPYVEMGSGMIQ